MVHREFILGKSSFCKTVKLKKELEKIIKEEYEHYDYFDKMMLKKERDQLSLALCGIMVVIY